MIRVRVGNPDPPTSRESHHVSHSATSSPSTQHAAPPLDEHGVIGDLRTLAVVATDATIDWMCWPRFDSPSVFASLLDDDGGAWTVTPTCPVTAHRQLYLSGTNVLITRFHTAGGLVEIEDLMSLAPHDRHVIRAVRCRRGSIELTSRIAARPDYGRTEPEVRTDDGTATITATADDFDTLVASGDVEWTADGCDLVTTFTVDEGEVAYLVLGDTVVGHELAAEMYTHAEHEWRAWADRSTYSGRWRESVERSALALKLLTHEPSGGILAAGTTSLPEVVGGERNWDYRYVWIRDAAFTLYAFISLGYLDEADAFTEWLVARLDRCEQRTDDDATPLSPLYTLDGDDDLDEVELDHWSGYADSRPVRIGNAASDQLQLDIYGALIDALYLADKHGPGLSVDTWRHVVTIVDWLGDHWEEPDDGMWEVRSGPQRHTSSLLMCWVAVERAIRMAQHRGRPAPLTAWCELRDTMHTTLVDEGYNDELEAFTQVLGGDTVDASMLLAPLTKFISPSDPRWTHTLDAITDGLAHGPLVDRYDTDTTDDGVDGHEGSFTICSFWYVEALARSGRTNEARVLFDRLLSYAGPTGIFSEEIGRDGRMVGNLPQAFTHLSLISAATALDEQLDIS